MSNVQVVGTALGTALSNFLGSDEIVPGSLPSYQLCKTLYETHPLGKKIADKPVELAMSKPKKITVQMDPGDRARQRFEEKWIEVGVDNTIFNLGSLSRVYGVASMAIVAEGEDASKPIDVFKLHNKKLSFNVFDPLNTAGSLVINQLPNSIDFMKASGWITVQGQQYHPSRNCVLMNEQPMYISYTTSAFGFTGRSVYQRILFPLKSFVRTMQTDDLVAIKSGVLVAMLKQAGSIIDAAMAFLFNQKRQVIKEAATYNVISVGQEDKIESIDLKNLEGPFENSRKNILENIAAGADDMPAKLLNQETFAEGFGEGTEDARMIAHYVNRIRKKLDPIYAFMERMIMHLAWTPEWYATIQNEFPDEYKGVEYNTALYRWINSFKSEWIPFIEEEPSEKIKVDDVKLKAVIAAVQVLIPECDPMNRAKVIEWLCDNFNEMPLLFGQRLDLDMYALMAYTPPDPLAEPEPGKPFAAADSILEFDGAVRRLVGSRNRAVPRLTNGKA